MIDKRAKVVILCEDLQQRTFICRLLKAYRFRDIIRIIYAPAGEQSAEQYVRNQYSIEVKGLRRKLGHLNQCLVTAIDADTRSVEHHYRELDQALVNAQMAKRQDGEPIVIFIPRRNIETWIHYLATGESVSEEISYQRLTGHESDCSMAVNEFVRQSRFLHENQLPDNCPDSLRQAYMETRRFPTG